MPTVDPLKTRQGQIAPNSDLAVNFVARKPGFVVWISRRNGRSCGFLAWSETAVAELSPQISDAWNFSSIKAANDAAGRAFGPAVEDFGIAAFPQNAALQPL